MDLTIVGCTGSLPGPDSPASCYLLTASEDGRRWQILLDLGAGSFGALQRHTEPDEIDAVVLSHLHPDHCLDVTAMRVWRGHGLSRPEGTLDIFGPRGSAERLARAYAAEEPEPLQGMVFHDLVDGASFAVGPFTITPYAVLHPVLAFGLRVEAGGAVLAYTGDTDTSPGLVPLMRDADLVLAEAAFVEGRDEERGIHLTGRRAAEAAVAAGGVRRLMLTHLPPWNDPDVCRAEAVEVWGPGVELAEPGRTYAVAPPGQDRRR
ncbi:MBL fold metallo-hydrolase [Ornithinimicrobium sp. Y1694]|uniref:MBL fold metallo-hydrolase n=1 Tax=Ornithinimicrobium sp. Y1694 TaxID=3418590 RepID=UPI003CF32FD2